MKRTYVKESVYCIGETILLKGWVHRVRHLGKISFMQLKDRTGKIQCVLEGELTGVHVSVESAVEVQGKVVETKQQGLGVELLVHSLTVLNKAQMLPFETNKEELTVNLDTLLNNRVLSMRNEKIQAIFSIKAKVVSLMQEFLMREDFHQIFTPKIVAQGAEGGANVFTFDYFGQSAYLAQSPQFYKQMMVIAGFERVFEIAPVFRAEQHNSSRHLNEYTSVDVELGFIESFLDVMKVEEKLLNYVFQGLKEHCEQELSLFTTELPEVGIIPSMTLAEAHKLLVTKFNKQSPDGDLDNEGERLLGEYVKESMNSDFVFITHYQKESRPMYTMPNPDNSAITDSFDLLYKGAEITSGGQRIHDYDMLIQSFTEKGLQPADFSSYTEAFKYGAPPHGGFAIGLERFIVKLLNLSNVREAAEFPRDIDRLVP
ncbi:aspartate--tRNA(Asn) ligase [Bacillus salitolerans]|uniref:Aspartate--tRNA ligase n=1 Tax=Bacillus salitolerans TaxID=1437434 RepID=A0ABW4LSQ4_9BACI